jgi:hypothetical protein
LDGVAGRDGRASGPDAVVPVSSVVLPVDTPVVASGAPLVSGNGAEELAANA